MDGSLLGPPGIVRIPSDQDRFESVGRLPDGRQIMGFVTGAFPDDARSNYETEEWRRVKRWVAVLHVFDAAGNHLSSDAQLGGFDTEGKDVSCEKAYVQLDSMLLRHGGEKLEHRDIWVKQFSVTVDGVTHSLLYQQCQPEEGGPTFEWVMLEPRDIMFHPPWDSGEYST